MNALHRVHGAGWDSFAARTKACTLLANACEVVSLRTLQNGLTHKELLRARLRGLPTMQVMRRWRRNVTRQSVPSLLCLFCGGTGGGPHSHVYCI